MCSHVLTTVYSRDMSCWSAVICRLRIYMNAARLDWEMLRRAVLEFTWEQSRADTGGERYILCPGMSLFDRDSNSLCRGFQYSARIAGIRRILVLLVWILATESHIAFTSLFNLASAALFDDVLCVISCVSPHDQARVKHRDFNFAERSISSGNFRGVFVFQFEINYAVFLKVPTCCAFPEIIRMLG